MILYIDCCMREESRTRYLAKKFLSGKDYESLIIENENIQPLNGKTLRERDALLNKGEFTAPMFRYANQFKEADTIVISAPYWDLLFPAALRAYIEQICVCGITFKYNEKGIPVSLCKAKKLIYVTTAGGYVGDNLGYEYVRQAASTFFGIEECKCIKAEGLDIWGNNPDEILKDVEI